MCDKWEQPLPYGQLNTQKSTALQFATSYTMKERELGAELKSPNSWANISYARPVS